mgnify:FL=1
MNKQFYKEELGSLIAKNSEQKLRIAALENQILDLTLEISELKDEIRNHNTYTETDGYEVGSPKDYEDDGQLDLFDVSK